MTPDPWKKIDVMLAGAWAPGNNPYGAVQRTAYRMALRELDSAGDRLYPDDLIQRALRSLMKQNLQFRPDPGAIAQECERIAGNYGLPPEFSLRICEEAAWSTRGITHSTTVVGKALGPVAAAWFYEQGYQAIRQADLGETVYASSNRQRIERSWEDFAGRHVQRIASGQSQRQSIAAVPARALVQGNQ